MVSRVSDAVCVAYAQLLFSAHPDTRRLSELVHAAFAAAVREVHTSAAAEATLRGWLCARELTFDAERVTQWCRDAHYEPGVLALALVRDDVDAALAAALRAADDAALRSVLATHAPSLAAEAWWLRVLASSAAAAASSALRLVLVRAALHALGAAATLRVLRALPPSSAFASRAVLRALLQAARVERGRADVARDAVESLDAYLWSQRPALLAPQFRAVSAAEAGGGALAAASATEGVPALPFARDSSAPRRGGAGGHVELAMDYTCAVPRSLEDAAVHAALSVRAVTPGSAASVRGGGSRVPGTVLARAQTTPLTVQRTQSPPPPPQQPQQHHQQQPAVRDALWTLGEAASVSARLTHA